MAVLYNVYLAKLATTPNNWDTANEADYDDPSGWVMMTCESIIDKVMVKNTQKHLTGHASYRLTVGKIIQSQTLNGCIIVNTGGSEDSDYYNEFKEFLIRHALSGTNMGYGLYLHVYDPSGAGQYMKFVDNGEVWQSHCKVAIKSFIFTLDHSGVYKGTITLEEVWG